MKAERNGPCPCGSGKKYKRCCALNPTSTYSGPCDFGCEKPAVGVLECSLCLDTRKRYAHCHDHLKEAQSTIGGHAFRAHPERLPQMLRKLIENEQEMELTRAKAALEPSLWGRVAFCAELMIQGLEPMFAPEDGQQMKIIRPDNPELAMAIAKVAVEKNDHALFDRLPAEVGDYTFVGFAALDRAKSRAVVVDARGKYLEDMRAGDSFVTDKTGLN